MFETGVLAGGRGAALKRRLAHTFHYWMETEVHVYGFSIAANVLLSFFPFLIVMISVCHGLLGWKTAGEAINLAIHDYFPDQLGAFINASLPHRNLQVASVFLLLFTANGVFEPLEVALNRAWGVRKNRTFVRNQMVSLGLIFACGTLALFSSLLTGISMRQLGGDVFSQFTTVIFFKMAAVPMSILMLFLIYWLLPNAKISWRFVLPPAVFVGLALELLKYINLLTWPLWRKKLHAEYGPFYYSVTIVLWSFLAAMVILAGAEWAAQAAAEQRRNALTQAAGEQAAVRRTSAEGPE
jgi:YihY family inner membrane protein